MLQAATVKNATNLAGVCSQITAIDAHALHVNPFLPQALRQGYDFARC
jgi:hypothetical protein